MLNRNIKWIMLVSGLITSTMFFATVAPDSALKMIFGEVLEGPLSEIIVRNWGALIGTVGLMLIYGAFNADTRKLVLVVASATKLVFIGLILTLGNAYLAKASVSIVIDAVFIVLFVIYLVTEGNQHHDEPS